MAVSGAPASISWEAQARAFPHDALEGCETALLLFGAGFHGWNDGWHVAHAGITATVVDTNTERLAEMREMYPADWTFIAADAFAEARRYLRDGLAFDFISVDPYSNLTDRCWQHIPLWASIARRSLLVTTTTATLHGVARGTRPPDGWRARPLIERTHGVYWHHLEKENPIAP